MAGGWGIRTGIRRPGALAALATIIFLNFGAFAQTGGAEEPGPSRRIIAGGAIFADARLGLTFTLPLTSVVRIRNRGNFHGVDIEPVDSAAFYIYHTSYRIRRPGALAALGAVFRPCVMPPIPAGLRFVVEARCAGTIGLNEIVRTVRLIRRDDVLHLFHVSSRVEVENLATAILASVRENQEFQSPPDVSAGDQAGQPTP